MRKTAAIAVVLVLILGGVLVYGLVNTHIKVADAAVLCPSFYRTDIVNNPGRWEKWKARVAARVIGLLQKRLTRKEYVHGI